jgi:predicted flap endonuclease-1-like 5' DNA nuclease
MYNSKKNLPAEMPAAKRRPKILKDIPGVGPAIEKRLITHD